MKYIKLFENFEDYDPYELMITPPNKKAEMIVSEIKKKDKANLNLVNDLIALGANLDWQDNDGWTALHLCAGWNRPEIVRMLLDAGADVNIQDNNGKTALYMCAGWNHSRIARMLIDAGADVNIQHIYGSTALHECANWNRPEIARMLIDAGADKTIPNNNGKLPYELANTQELKELLKPFNETINSSITKILNDIEQWMSGECIPFCVALNEIFPHYQIAVINDEFEDVDEDAEYNFNFVHAFCYHPNNHNIIIDARGVRKLKDLYEDFYDINPIIDWDIPNTKYLIDNYAGKEFASEESFEYDISEYQSAKDYISKNIQKYSVNLK